MKLFIILTTASELTVAPLIATIWSSICSSSPVFVSISFFAGAFLNWLPKNSSFILLPNPGVSLLARTLKPKKFSKF